LHRGCFKNNVRFPQSFEFRAQPSHNEMIIRTSSERPLLPFHSRGASVN
jgi:hypothetical protein